MIALLGILLVFEVMYVAMIMLILLLTTDYYCNWKQFWCDLLIPYWRLIRELIIYKIRDKYFSK